MNVLDLFSGFGACSLGLERAGMKTIAFCEVKHYCHKILKGHWPDVPVFEDIKKLSSDDLPNKPDVISGCYPCRSFSDDCYNWPEMLRLITEIKPNFIICESIFGHVGSKLDKVLPALGDRNYTVCPILVQGCTVNSTQTKDRLFIMAYSQNYRLSDVGESLEHENTDRKLNKEDGEKITEGSVKVVAEDGSCLVTDKNPGNCIVPGIMETIGRIILSFHAVNRG